MRTVFAGVGRCATLRLCLCRALVGGFFQVEVSRTKGSEGASLIRSVEYCRVQMSTYHVAKENWANE